MAQELFALSEPPFNLFSLTGMAFVQGVSFVSGAFFMLAAAYQSMDPSLEEAAYTSGVGKLKTFLKINIPITWQAIAAVMVYLIMTAIAVFEVPAIIGLPARIHVLSSLIFTSTTPSTGLPEYGMAGAYGAIMLFLGLVLAFMYVRLVKQGKKYTVITGRGYRRGSAHSASGMGPPSPLSSFIYASRSLSPSPCSYGPRCCRIYSCRRRKLFHP